MPTTVVERYGSLSATGVAKESTFGTPVTSSVFLPMTGNNLEVDPGLFSPKVMMGVRDVNTFPLYGQYKVAGSINAPLFPTMGATLVAGSIGQDATAGNGVTGTGSTSPTTLSGSTSAGATTVTVASATGYTVGSIVQVDVNASGPTTTAEVRKVTNVATNVLTLDTALTYGHASNAPVKIVTAPYTHTFTQATTLPSFTVEKNLGNYQSLQFAGARVNKLGLQVQNSNQEATANFDLMAKSATVLDTPTAITVTNELPFVFAEATASIFGQAVTQCTQAEVDIENGLKDTYTFNASHNLQFLTPVSLKVSAKADLVFTSLDDVTWGYWTQMVNGTEGAFSLQLAHPTNGGSFTFNMSRVRIRTSTDAVKLEDVIVSTLQFDAFLNFTSLTTVSATVANSSYLPY